MLGKSDYKPMNKIEIIIMNQTKTTYLNLNYTQKIRLKSIDII